MKNLCVCYNHKAKYTDWFPIPNDGGLGICLCMWKHVKEVALKILNNGRNQRLTLTFQIKESFGLLSFHIKESEWNLRSPKFKT